MQVSVNGSAADVAVGTTVAALLDGQAIDPRGVAIAVNEAVVPKSTWGRVVLVDGDRIEILVAAQGG